MTPAASDDEAAAVALLTAFKTASVSMFSELDWNSYVKVNAAFALSFTEVADAAPDADDGASAMTTFAVAIAAAVAALF